MTLGVAAAIVGGAFTWTFLEYVIHRWLGHDARLRNNLFGREHVRHHAEGGYFAPSIKKIFAASVVALLVGAPAVALAGRFGAAYVGGLLGFYTVYEILHRLEHVWGGIGPYARWARRHHFSHHFEDPRFNHGVTSPLWDFVFGTYRTPTRIVVPRKLCMRWLRDPTTGQVRAQWAHVFRLAD